MHNATGADQPPADSDEHVASSSQAGATEPAEEKGAREPEAAPSSARKQDLGKEASLALAARLASEAALEARGKASGRATAAVEEDVSHAGPAAEGAPSESAGAEGQNADVLAPIMQTPLVMTVGAPEPAAKKKGLRSPAAAKVSVLQPQASVEETFMPEAGTENSVKTPQPNATATGQLGATSESSAHAAAEEGCEPAGLADGVLPAAQGQSEAAVTQTAEGACSNLEAPSTQTAAPVTPEMTLSGNEHMSLQLISLEILNRACQNHNSNPLLELDDCSLPG